MNECSYNKLIVNVNVLDVDSILVFCIRVLTYMDVSCMCVGTTRCCRLYFTYYVIYIQKKFVLGLIEKMICPMYFCE